MNYRYFYILGFLFMLYPISYAGAHDLDTVQARHERLSGTNENRYDRMKALREDHREDSIRDRQESYERLRERRNDAEYIHRTTQDTPQTRRAVETERLQERRARMQERLERDNDRRFRVND